MEQFASTPHIFHSIFLKDMHKSTTIFSDTRVCRVGAHTTGKAFLVKRAYFKEELIMVIYRVTSNHALIVMLQFSLRVSIINHSKCTDSNGGFYGALHTNYLSP